MYIYIQYTIYLCMYIYMNVCISLTFLKALSIPFQSIWSQLINFYENRVETFLFSHYLQCFK